MTAPRDEAAAPPPSLRHGGLRRAATGAILSLLGLVGTQKRPPVPVADFRRIMVFRFGGMGDCIVVTGLLAALRKRFPQAHIAIATLPACRAVFDNNPDVDEIVTGSASAQRFAPAAYLERTCALRRWSAEPWDLSIFTHNAFHEMAMAWAFRAHYRVGFDTDARGFDFAMTHSAPNWTDAAKRGLPRRHVSSHFDDLLRAVIGPFESQGPRICLTADERDRSAAWLATAGLGPHPVLIALGGTSSVKLWPVARFAMLAHRIVAELGRSVVAIGGPDEARLAPEFATCGPGVRFAAGEFTLRESFALIGEAAALVGGDTGVMHAGAALGVPLVGLFGPTPAFVYGYEGDRRMVLSAPLDCVPCESDVCRRLQPGAARATPPCMTALEPGQVLDALRRVMKG